VSVAALTIYDAWPKAAERDHAHGKHPSVHKRGGKSGDFVSDEGQAVERAEPEGAVPTTMMRVKVRLFAAPREGARRERAGA